MMHHEFPHVDPKLREKHADQFFGLIDENPWLLPALASLEMIPVATFIHGFWKNRQLRTKLKIEREKTKQLMFHGPQATQPGHHLPHPHHH